MRVRHDRGRDRIHSGSCTMNIGIKSLLTGACCCCWRGRRPWYCWGKSGEAGESWLSGAEGYEQAQRLALREGYPLLYVIERAKCRRCKALNTRLWRAPRCNPPGGGEGATQPGCGDGSEHSAPLPRLRRPQASMSSDREPPPHQDRGGYRTDLDARRHPMVGGFMPPGAAFEAVLRVTLSLEDPPSTTRPCPEGGSEGGESGGQRRPLTAVCSGLSAEVEQTGHQHGILLPPGAIVVGAAAIPANPSLS